MVFIIGDVNATAVLGTHIIALAVQAGRVVNLEKNIQDVTQRDDTVVVLQTHHFVKTCAPCADLFIGGSSRPQTIAVTRLDIQHPTHTHKHSLCAPETAAAQSNACICHAEHLSHSCSLWETQGFTLLIAYADLDWSFQTPDFRPVVATGLPFATDVGGGGVDAVL